MPQAEIITIGTEILLGEIVDTNSRHIARTLRDVGVDIYWLSTVGDNPQRIAEAIRQALERSEIIICTGGLGPTVDDPTRQAVALAIGVETEFKPELWQQVVDRFARYGRTPTENNKRQAYVPQGAIAVENPVGTAPAFIVETERSVVVALPGVPHEMEHLLEHAILPYLRQRFKLHGVIIARLLRTAGAGESSIDELIGDLEEGSNPTVGLAAHAGQVDVRIAAKADTLEEAEALIAPVEADLRTRLGEWIFGTDEQTLEGVALDHLAELGWQVVVVEAGLGGRLTSTLADTQHQTFLGGEVLSGCCPDLDTLKQSCHNYQNNRQADICLGISLVPGDEKQTLHLVLSSPVKEHTITRTYGGPPRLAPRWAVNVGLDLLRRIDIKE